MQTSQLQSYVLKPYIVDLLNEIKRDQIKRRVKRELVILSEDENLEIVTISFDNKGDPIITIADMNPSSNNNINNNNNDSLSIYEIYISENYPFTCPKIKVNGEDYLAFLRIKTQKFSHILKNITGLSCLCCNSYLCSENWTPVTTLYKMIHEIRNMRKKKRTIINKFYADKIKDRYLIDDINLDEWLF
jgi:ubiquitin-protein ligase